MLNFFFGSKRKSVKTIQISLWAFVAAWILHAIGGLEPLRRWSFAVVSTLREVRLFGGPDTKPSPEIVVCAIDEDSIRQMGVWPWPRSTYAKLVRQVAQDGAAAIGLNALLSERDPAGAGNDLDLVTQITKSGNTVLPCIVTLAGPSTSSARTGRLPDIYPLPEYQQAAAGIGFVNVGADAAHIKIILTGRDAKNQPILSFPLAVYEGYARQKVEVESWAARVGDLKIPLEGQGLLWVDYPRAGPVPTGYTGTIIPASQVLNGTLKRGALAG